MRIFAFATAKSGCSWYRVEMPFREIEKAGHEVTVTHHYGAHLPRDICDYDVVVGQILGTPIGADLWEILAGKPNRPKMVYEIDDDFFSPVADDLKQYREPMAIEAVKTGLRCADAVTVSTGTLAGVVAPFTSAPVHVLPNCIPAWLLSHHRPRKTRLVVGWQGAQAHQGDWVDANLAVARAGGSKRSRVEFHTMGARCTTAPKPDRHSDWKLPVEDYYHDVDFDIALAPLADTQFNRSKSHIRVLEAAALGIPVVASDVLPYREFVQDGKTGFIAKKPSVWAACLRELLDTPSTRSHMSANARALASLWTIEDRWKDWLAVYEKEL